MSSRMAKIQESNLVPLLDIITITDGNGDLPSICPQCKGQLDFGRIGEDELVCRNKCGFKFIRDN